MHVESKSNLSVTERPLFRSSGEEAYVEKKPCTKIVTDTISKRSFSLNQYSWLDDKRHSGAIKAHIGENLIWFYYEKEKVYMIVLPDNCTCKWTASFPKELLPFVKLSMQHIVFTESY